MYPIYQHMDSYPHQRPPYTPYNPNLESNPYQMNPNFVKSPSPYEYGLYGINNYYHPRPHPMEFQGCCNHNYFPSCYTFQPPYPHFPPPPPPQPFHCHGSYYAPHSHYPMELPPRYDYDKHYKNTPRDHHCCGFSNHSCTGKDDKIVKIEEPDPDGVKMGDSLVLNQLKNYPYPMVWIAPSYLQNKEDGQETPVEVESKGKMGSEDSKPIEEEPRFLNGWLPLDINKLGSLMQGGDGRKVQNQRNDEEGRFPFSIFRVPYNPEELDPKENKLSSHFSITPMDASDTEDSKRKSLLRGNGKDSDSVHKMIPEKAEKEIEKETVGKAKNIPVEFRTDNEERSSSPSPLKSTKLPPVCLRVDPLPGKKRSSRSPSPPANTKGKSDKSPSENGQENITQSSELVEKSKDMKVIEVVKNDSEKGNCGSEELTEGKNVILGQSGDGKCEVGKDKGESEAMKEKVDDEANRASRKILSDGEAAVIIQSAYRGYEVRKWETLIKLKQVAKVKDQVAEVKRTIEALESSLTDLGRDDKPRLVIGEIIMSLLLKLDTIQGLHPSIRDVRKSVARQLVNLQEKLDSLTSKKHVEGIKNREDLELKPSNEVLNDGKVLEKAQGKELDHGNELGVVEGINGKAEESPVQPLQGEAMKADDVVLAIEAEEPPKQEIPSVEEENDEKVLEKVREKELNHSNEPGVVEGIIGKANESPVEPLEGDAIEAVDAVLAVEAEVPKPEFQSLEEENDEKVLEGVRLEAEVQPEEAQQQEFDHTEEEISGETEEMTVKLLEGEVQHANNKVQAIEVEEPQPKIPSVEEENDEKVLEEDRVEVEAEIQPDEAQHDEFDHTEEENTGKIEEFEVQHLEDEVPHAKDKVQAIEAEEPKPKIPSLEEEKDEKFLEEGRFEAEVQPEEARQDEFDHTEEITGKTAEFAGKPLEAEVIHDNDKVQAIDAEEPQEKLLYMEDEVNNANKVAQIVEAEEPQLKLTYMEAEVKNASDIVQVVDEAEQQPKLERAEEVKDANDKVQVVEAEEPQPKLPCVQSEVNENGESSELGDRELAVDNIIEGKLREENEKLKAMVEKLVEAGKVQLSAISNLSGKVKDLERKLSKKKRLKMRKCVRKSRTFDDH